MTSTSFSSVQSQTPQAISSTQTAPMKEGQVVHGTVKQLFPNQTAEIQIGNQKVIAKLETPLKAGDAHFFQVSKQAPELQLKVVSEPLTQGNTPAQQANQLMQSMNLPKTPEMQAIVQFFLKEQLPISKEALLQAEQLIKQLPADVTMKAALEALQKMMEMKFPLTQQVFDAVISGKSTDGLQSLINSFKLALQQDTTLPLSVKESILQSLQKLAEPFGQPVAGALLGKQLETLQNAQTNISTRLPLLQILKEAAILPAQATLSNPTPPVAQPAIPNTAGDLMARLLQAPASEKVAIIEQIRTLIQSQPLLTSGQKEQILSLIKDTNQPAQMQNLNNALVKAFAEQSQQAIFSKDQNGLTPKDHLVSLLGKGNNAEMINQTLQQVITMTKSSPNAMLTQQIAQSEAAILQQLDGKAFEHAMKDVLRSLGFSYEARLGSNSEDLRQLALQLKPQLVDILQNQAASATLRDQAELVLGRMNGMQLLSAENGPQHQLLMQVPLEFLGKKMDATLEWKGRMLENGKIDPDFARIMFYLQLDALEETVVDMQVQNRVVTISLFNNDTRLQQVANTFKDSLKDGLSAVGYKLSGVFVKTFEEQKLSSPLKVKGPLLESQGVDIRI
ncbi:hypothetical protein [Psychrobacillus sp.]|uniref:hypothetical protein n=1 Tax=Psychrobacillus sp. TaxID=1871623 RepID=UPI0028BE5D2E|nr:hypothetical protein [Psychrobacillus sp.]